MAQGTPSRSWLVGFLAGGWVATLLAFSGWSPISSARAQDATPSPNPNPGPVVPFDPIDPTSPGRSVTPPGGLTRGMPNPGLGGSGFNNRAIALSASAGGGESVVYYFDTELSRLLVYQFRPGDRGGVKLMAARHIDYDLKLEKYRDLSDKDRDELKSDYEAMLRAHANPASSELPVKKVEILPGR